MADSSNSYIRLQKLMVSMARDRIYFALQSYQDKTSFDDNAIWLLS